MFPWHQLPDETQRPYTPPVSLWLGPLTPTKPLNLPDTPEKPSQLLNSPSLDLYKNPFENWNSNGTLEKKIEKKPRQKQKSYQPFNPTKRSFYFREKNPNTVLPEGDSTTNRRPQKQKKTKIKLLKT